MKKIVAITFLLISNIIVSQTKNSEWKLFDKESVVYKSITLDSTRLKVKNVTFMAIWKDSVSYSSNLGYLQGLKSLKIYKNEKLVNEMFQVEDQVALQEFVFTFYDYNFDGYLDFSYRRECGKNCFFSYYIFDKAKNKFIHAKEWDYLRIQQINHRKHLIKTQPDGMVDDSEIFKVVEMKLIEQKK